MDKLIQYKPKLAKQLGPSLTTKLSVVFLILLLILSGSPGLDVLAEDDTDDTLDFTITEVVVSPITSPLDNFVWGQGNNIYDKGIVIKGKGLPNTAGNSSGNSSITNGDDEDKKDDAATSSAPKYLTPTSEYPFSMNTSSYMSALQAGSVGQLMFDITNISGHDLYLREVVMEGQGEGFPFEVNQARIKAEFSNTFDPTRAFIEFWPMRVKANLTDGYYNLNFTIRFQIFDEDFDKDPNGPKTEIYEQKISLSVKVNGDPANREGQRVMITAAPLATQMGSYGAGLNLQIGLINRGFDPVDIISVTPVISAEANNWPFDIAQQDYAKAIGQTLKPLAPGAANGSTSDGTLLMVDFGNLTVREDIGSGYKELSFNVQHKLGNMPIETTTITVYVDIAGNPNTDWENSPNAGQSWPQSKPRLMCTGFETNPKELMGGDTFTLKLHLKNTSALTGIQNIRIELASDGVGEGGVAPFMTESGANSFYIPWIGAEEEYELDVLMIASSQVAQKTYPLTINMEYEDWQASGISAREAISIQLRQEVRMDHGKIDIMPQEINVGQEANLMFPIYNKGKTTLYNVTVTMPQGQGVSVSEHFVGNINPGATAQVDLMVKGESPVFMDETLTLTVNYEDENGQLDSKDFDFTMTVNEDMPMDDMWGGMDDFYPDDFPDPNIGQMETENPMLNIMPLWAWIGLGVLVLIFLIMIISMVRKKKKRKRMTMEDEAYFKDLLQ